MEHKKLFGYLFCLFAGAFVYFSFYTSYQNYMSERPRRFINERPRHIKNHPLQCNRILNNDQKYINEARKKKITLKGEDEDFKTDCFSINKRAYFSQKSRSKEEEGFPIAYAKIVFKDYLFIEQELSAEYAPQNFYCFSIDVKASDLFKRRMRDLSKCLPNVIVPDKEFNMSSTGSYHNHAYLECFKELAKHKWKYVILMQNHDIILRTNSELVQIFQWFNGSNNIGIDNMEPYMYRIDTSSNWTYEGMKLFKKPRNVSPMPKFVFTKSLVESCLSREFIDFILNELDLTIILANLQMKLGSPEETLLATLNAADFIGAPGGFTHACLDRKPPIEVDSITRRTAWAYGDTPSWCKSGYTRHGICIYGIEQLHEFESFPKIMLNKMLPDFDFGAISCWHERLFNKTYLNANSSYKLNPDYYLNLPQVRYNHEKTMNGKVDLEKFDCKMDNSITPMLKI